MWSYTGYRHEELVTFKNRLWQALLVETDVLVDGFFVEALNPMRHTFKTASNQRLIDTKRSRAEGEVVLWQRPDPLAHFQRPES